MYGGRNRIKTLAHFHMYLLFMSTIAGGEGAHPISSQEVLYRVGRGQENYGVSRC